MIDCRGLVVTSAAVVPSSPRRRATAKSTANAEPRPIGPVTSQARNLFTRIPVAGEKPSLEQGPVAGRDRPPRPALVERDSTSFCAARSAAASHPLPGRARRTSRPGPRGAGSPLDHHDGPGGALVGERGDVPVTLARRVDRVEHRARPHQDVAEDRAGEADRDTYPIFQPVPNHSGFGSGPNTGIHIRQPKKTKVECSSAWIGAAPYASW